MNPDARHGPPEPDDSAAGRTGGPGPAGGRPWALVAEALVAVVLVALSVWFWNLGVQPARTPVDVEGHGPVPVTLYNGARITTSVVMMAVAGLAAVDALRRAAVRWRVPTR